MMQSVPELVKECKYVIMGEQRRALVARREEIAHQLGHRPGQPRGEALASDTLVHPGAAALVGPCVGIEVEVPDRLAVGAFDLEKAHIRMPDRHALALADAYAKQTLGDFEETGKHAR